MKDTGATFSEFIELVDSYAKPDTKIAGTHVGDIFILVVCEKDTTDSTIKDAALLAAALHDSHACVIIRPGFSLYILPLSDEAAEIIMGAGGALKPAA